LEEPTDASFSGKRRIRDLPMATQLDEIKTLIVVGDGMADEPVASLGGKTPLQVARKPNIDFFARSGIVGRFRPVPEGMAPGSDVANLSVMGYDPAKYYTGRAPLEAASMGIEMGETDVAFRCNLVTLEKEGSGFLMADYSGGGISTDRAKEVIGLLNEELSGPERLFFAGVSYRHLLLWRNGAARFQGVETTPPHDITGRRIQPHLPRGNGGEELVRLMEQAGRLLAAIHPARERSAPDPGPNAVWLWGQGRVPVMPSFAERFQMRGATVCAVDLIKGLGRTAGMNSLAVPGATGDIDTNFQGKAIAALKALRNHDLVFLHVESPDEASHRGNLAEKIRSIERLDEEVVGVLRKGLSLMGYAYRLLILPDHATPLRTRTHSDEPAPFLFYRDPPDLPVSPVFHGGVGRAASFDEIEAGRTGILFTRGHELLGAVLNRTP
jgi:2,3-bisphosphoglycerate-independent phosphoglycerate mutase